MITAPPSLYVAQFLVDEGLVTWTGNTWPVTQPNLPDDAPDGRVAVVDLFPVLDGRDMETGEGFEHPGVQVVIRGRYNAAWAKGRAIRAALLAAKRVNVAPSGEDEVLIQSFTLTQGLVRYGSAARNNNDLLSFSGTVTLSEV